MVFQVSWDTDVFETAELYLGHGLEMADHSVVTLGETLHNQC